MVALNEAAYQDRICDLARILGWLVFHTRPAQSAKGWRTAVKYDGKGFTDLVMLHPRGYVIFAEIKADDGSLTVDQKKWGVAFDGAMRVIDDPRVRYVVWRPRDWERVVAALEAPRSNKG